MSKQMHKHSREFIRHPTDIPIEVSLSQEPSRAHPTLSNISKGGLAFVQRRPFPVGAILQIRIPFSDPPLQAQGQVVWCHPCDQGYEIGVHFLDTTDVFNVRMVEQVCHIEQYKRHVEKTEGRTLSGEEAANEWIQKFAGQFPALH